jgi:hypothetical protein
MEDRYGLAEQGERSAAATAVSVASPDKGPAIRAVNRSTAIRVESCADAKHDVTEIVTLAEGS